MIDWEETEAPLTVYTGDCRDVLRSMSDESVHCCVTSPPYFGLRDYGVDGQLGLEATPAEYVAGMVAVFREVRRVLRDDGTLWLNIGDSYSNGTHDPKSFRRDRAACNPMGRRGTDCDPKRGQSAPGQPRHHATGLREKNLIGIPWRLAFALQDDGWCLRQDIIWHKTNAMPEAVQDRCTKAHEYLFLMTKKPRYYFDSEAIQEPAATAPHAGGHASGDKYAVGPMARGGCSQRQDPSRIWGGGDTRNRRSVWAVATTPYSGAHFATFPPRLIEPCILAGCPEGGLVLDPFAGSGTTGQVAIERGRGAVLIELNPAYCDLIRKRLEPVVLAAKGGPLFAGIATGSSRSVAGNVQAKAGVASDASARRHPWESARRI